MTMRFWRDAVVALIGAVASFALFALVATLIGRTGLTPLGRSLHAIVSRQRAGASAAEILSDPQVIELLLHGGRYLDWVILPGIAIVVGCLVGCFSSTKRWVW